MKYPVLMVGSEPKSVTKLFHDGYPIKITVSDCAFLCGYWGYKRTTAILLCRACSLL